MKHLFENDLVRHYYGEGGAGTATHLAECAECKRKFEQLYGMLSSIALPEPPPRGEGYSAEVWSRIRHKLNQRPKPRPWWGLPRRWAGVVAVAALIAIAFLVGRHTNQPPRNPPIEATNHPELPQKVLVIALGDYLDRSEMLLVEVAHAKRPEDLDLSTERRYASELLATNRLYRQTAQRVGDTGTDALLDQLEPVLLQLEHTPEGATASDIQQLRQEIESGALLFKVRVAQVHMKAEAKSNNRARTGEGPRTPQNQIPIL